MSPAISERKSLQNVTRVCVWLLLLWCTENPLCAFPDFWRRSYSFSYNQEFLAKIRCLKEEQVAEIEIWKEAGNCKELGVGLIDPETREDVAGRIRMVLKYVPAQILLDQSLPTDVDMTRRYSIVSTTRI